MRSSWLRRLCVVGCAVAVATAGWAPAALAEPTPDPDRARIDTVVHDSAQQSTLIVYSAAMRKLIPVNVLRPKDTTKSRPTLYLLNGAGGAEQQAGTRVVPHDAGGTAGAVDDEGGGDSSPRGGVDRWQEALGDVHQRTLSLAG